MHIKQLVVVAAVTESAVAGLLPNTNAHYGSSPSPFKIDVDPKFIEGVRQRVATARTPTQVEGVQPIGADGPTLANFSAVTEYWAKQYDWSGVQDSINARLQQFTTTVHIANYSDPVPLHFVHHKSDRADAIPLLFVHGWPGSFLEVENIIDRLTNPPNASLPAFHVVAPSIPGFGFSPAPTQDGFGGIASAASFNELMHQLNYTTYVCQGGDIGSFVIRYEAAMFPDSVVSILSNLWVVHPNNTDMERYKAHKTTDGETTYIEGLENFIHASSGYRIEQETLPLTLAYALTDSPSGYSMWIYALMRILIDPRVSQWTPEEIITWSMMYIIQGPYGGLRIYKELQQDGAFIPLQVIGPMPFVKQPTAITQRPYDLGFGMPLEWAQRVGNVVVRYQHAYGGHFAAWQTPESLAQDLWNFFGNEELSGTSVFSHGGSSSK